MDKAAKDVLNYSENQVINIGKILDWLKIRNMLGRSVADTLSDLKDLSDKLKERSNDMKTIPGTK